LASQFAFVARRTEIAGLQTAMRYRHAHSPDIGSCTVATMTFWLGLGRRRGEGLEWRADHVGLFGACSEYQMPQPCQGHVLLLQQVQQLRDRFGHGFDALVILGTDLSANLLQEHVAFRFG